MSIKERLDVVLYRNRIASHRSCRRFIQYHDVRINGQKVLTTGTPFDANSDLLTVDGNAFCVKRELYLVMNKPAGYVCTAMEADERSIFSLLPPEILNFDSPGKLHTVGRLDMDTTGLLIFTTNGDFSHELVVPEFHVSKKYLVGLESPVDQLTLEQWRDQVHQGVFCSHAMKEKGFYSESGELYWNEKPDDAESRLWSSCVLEISEGKFHQVKRMIATLGNRVVTLKRLSMGSLVLDPQLHEGQFREMSDDELAAVMKKK